MKTREFLRHVLGFLLFLTFITASFTSGYFIVRLFHFLSSDYLRYMVATIISILILGILGFIIHFFTKDKQRRLYFEIIDALRKIAKGDFNVYLDIRTNGRNEFIELIDHFNHMARELKQMEEMRQEFISNVSHEIQSPLTSITGFAKALQNNELPMEERNHYLSIIETESKRLSKLSDNLLKLTSLESEHHPFERKSYRLDQQIRRIILACEPNWIEKEIEMDVSLEKVVIMADEDLMSQVWINLIHNSIKFTPSKGRISVQLKESNDQAIIKISDTGMGISNKDLVHIFERFYKADQARQRSKGGSGLGLSIVKKVIEMHDGGIIVESAEGEGTTFTVSLPI
ncbi:sensor histidine kinase [Neobacillus sp. LXY-1]|uniref:sensor histidine kinase n=1 Tax=Neobacillus sp. LXY-1 TaxID=3379133 RepID=UPI003EE3730B